MSHATVVVFAASLEQAEHLLHPYSEEDVDEHDVPCICVGKKAQTEAEDVVNIILGKTRKEEGDLFNEKYPRKMHGIEDVDGSDMWKEITDRQSLFEKECLDPRQKLIQVVLDTLSNKETPDPACDDCHGTGKVKTRYNPLAKHDYFYHEFSEYGRGPWSWDVALKPEDVQENSNGKQIPFAIVTPMHGWQEGAELGWWGMTSDRKEEKVWHDLYFTAVKDALAMNLKPFRFDYHI